jgi:hypothetical protein
MVAQTASLGSVDLGIRYFGVTCKDKCVGCVARYRRIARQQLQVLLGSDAL